MIEPPRPKSPAPACRTEPTSHTRRRPELAAFLTGLTATLALFAFFPGLPHVIDWGATLASLTVGGLTQWSYRSWITRTQS
ncbi:hypothetical protein [Streptomyces sp. NPDC050535]|uniref:hypothetical protein n=1 Tax=Streptomyces sp. NPDC050535 TaxID=3365626 RepID=UPI003792859E